MLVSRAGSFGQSPSLSLQTPSKNRLRKSLEGFMRRLSGGRETQVWSHGSNVHLIKNVFNL